MNKTTTLEEKSDPKDRAKVAIKGHLIQTFILQKTKLGLRESKPSCEGQDQNPRVSRDRPTPHSHIEPQGEHSHCPPRPGSRH